MNQYQPDLSNQYQPEKLFNVKQSQLSVARFYGGCKFNGATYVYNEADDTLTREDILKKQKKAKKKKESRHEIDLLW